MSQDSGNNLVPRASQMGRYIANFLLCFGPAIAVVAWEGGKILLCAGPQLDLSTCIILQQQDHQLLGKILFDAGFSLTGPAVWLGWQVVTFKKRYLPSGKKD